MKPQLAFVATGSLLVAACADSGANYRPILDGTPTAAYETDLAACQALARGQFRHEALGATVLGTGIGAAMGKADSGDALGGAAAGALTGGLMSAIDSKEHREAIVVECMRGRSHRVVGCDNDDG